ncbi:MAG: hypothetical protein COA59_06000 [Colwellia sp.]|jgi:hypothetical protein|nr:MAG: hypothetical protein COA59_06000 [Colwellia sp.]
MNILIAISFQISIFSVGMFCGALMSDIEWYDTLTNEVAKCSVLDTKELCDAKINFNKAIKEFNNAD